MNIPLVSVVIPAFNASKTIVETLTSVLTQTYANLEIIVVDDGSVDQTATVVETYRPRDTRVRLIRTENRGVAAARNVGIKAASGEYIAFIDADDLWHPTKTAKQMAVMAAGGPDMALVYSPFRRIDCNNMVLGAGRNHRVEGWVVNRHFFVNIVGNGSSILVKKRVLEEFGGYSPGLRDVGAQGCEDMLLQLRIALHYRFGTVPEYLVAYRESVGNMSSNKERMLRSGILALTMALAECPNFAELAERGLLGRTIWDYLKCSISQGLPAKDRAFIRPYLRGRMGLVAKAVLSEIQGKMLGLYRYLRMPPTLWFRPHALFAQHRFQEYDPADDRFNSYETVTDGKSTLDGIYRELHRLSPLDASYRPEKYFGSSINTAAKAGPSERVMTGAAGWPEEMK